MVSQCNEAGRHMSNVYLVVGVDSHALRNRSDGLAAPLQVFVPDVGECQCRLSAE